MPFVRISLLRGRPAGFQRRIGTMVFRTLAERLRHALGVRMAGVFVSLVEVKIEDRSFGNRVAQYAE